MISKLIGCMDNVLDDNITIEKFFKNNCNNSTGTLNTFGFNPDTEVGIYVEDANKDLWNAQINKSTFDIFLNWNAKTFFNVTLNVFGNGKSLKKSYMYNMLKEFLMIDSKEQEYLMKTQVDKISGFIKLKDFIYDNRDELVQTGLKTLDMIDEIKILGEIKKVQKGNISKVFVSKADSVIDIVEKQRNLLKENAPLYKKIDISTAIDITNWSAGQICLANDLYKGYIEKGTSLKLINSYIAGNNDYNTSFWREAYIDSSNSVLQECENSNIFSKSFRIIFDFLTEKAPSIAMDSLSGGKLKTKLAMTLVKEFTDFGFTLKEKQEAANNLILSSTAFGLQEMIGQVYNRTRDEIIKNSYQMNMQQKIKLYNSAVMYLRASILARKYMIKVYENNKIIDFTNSKYWEQAKNCLEKKNDVTYKILAKWINTIYQ